MSFFCYSIMQLQVAWYLCNFIICHLDMYLRVNKNAWYWKSSFCFFIYMLLLLLLINSHPNSRINFVWFCRILFVWFHKGKIVTVYMNFEGSQWGSKIFRGEILEARRDHIILKDIQNKVNYLLLTIYHILHLMKQLIMTYL